MLNKSLKHVFVSLFVVLFIPQSVAFADSKIWVEAESSSPEVSIQLPSFAPIVDKLAPAVVNISTEGETKPQNLKIDPNTGLQNFPFEELFNNPNARQSMPSSLGSGFVIHPDGYIVTNAHVVQNAAKIYVTFKEDKKKYEAKVIGKDKQTDLALLKIDSNKKLKSVVVGDSEDLTVGDWVIAIGNPFRLGHTVTVGIVSATSRRVPGGGPYDDFIQTDASINPGNSGGPLFDASGRVVGVNTAIFSPYARGNSGFNIGIGFAIPIRLAKNIIEQLYENGKVTRGWLGVLIQDVSEDVAAAMNLSEPEGALVADVVSESPAEKAGIERGDVILKYDGKKVRENDDLPIMVAQTEIGSKVKVQVIRNGKKKTLSIKIEELDETQNYIAGTTEIENELGLTAQDVTNDIAEILSLDTLKGVVVTQITPGSPAARSKLRRGDLILQVGSNEVETLKDFREELKSISSGKPVLLLVKRGTNTIFLTLRTE